MDLNFYKENGYYIEEGVFSDEECKRYIEAAKALEESNHSAISYKPIMMPHRLNEIYLEALRHPRIVASIAQIVGGKPVGLQTEFFFCKPGTAGFSLHQDDFYVEAPTEFFASTWCPLTDTSYKNGGLIIYPGSHKEGLLPVRKLTLPKDSGQDPNANNEEVIVPPQYKPLNVSVPKGAALYIHSCLVHGSNKNISQDWRYVLLNTYIREGETFRPGNYAKRAPIPL